MAKVFNHTASGEWSFIPIKIGSGGAGQISGDGASLIIDTANETWQDMGLTEEQRAFGIALMDVESGFNPNAAYNGPLNSHAFGLGQFQPGTWDQVVQRYNMLRPDDQKISATDTGYMNQIKVLGEWIQDTLWPKAEQMLNNPILRGYSIYDIAYALHHQGQNSDASRIKDYLETEYKAGKYDKWINNVTGDVIGHLISGVIINGPSWTIPYGENVREVYSKDRSILSAGSKVNLQAAGSPIILDLDKDGVETTALTSGTYFDHDANGFSEQTGWASSDDGLLVMDKDGDGLIENGTELFGDNTILANGTKASNGFQALADITSFRLLAISR